ncbi:uncharacterized protein LOC126826808 isoform X1 [Patella vulgata]|uniref:uncharacterized protein LOC126811503 isoform X1 n=5 Tax=Patella vulgata TaxID=6465 RepID=UPI00217FD99C|nr:uncharacterized protein LOC126811503 isoform X1 [Patella vulgata]XP_050411855.1 uncharacterized protein LOC126826808 isoform X1 [Patella vulgata]
MDIEESFTIERPYQLPDPVIESSMSEDEQDISVFAEEEPELAYTIEEAATTRGKKKLFDNIGFAYTIKTDKKTTVWRCCKRNGSLTCPATVIQDGTDFKKGLKEHIHPAEPGILTAAKIKVTAKKEAIGNIFTRSCPSIAESVMASVGSVNEPVYSRPPLAALIRSVQRTRQTLRPNDPVDMSSPLDEDFIDSNAPGFYQKRVKVGERRHHIFATEDQLRLLAKAKTWYMDATFRVINKPYSQLFSIHAFVKAGETTKQVPLVFCVMSGKSQDDYYKVLRAVDKMLPSQIALEGFVVDFEAGLWQALRRRFVDIRIQGCVFHWTQAVFRKIQEKGFQTAYNEKGDVFNYLRRLMALPFLPEEHVAGMFAHLKDRCPEQLEPICTYIEDQWISSRLFPIEDWCVFMLPVRTNNDVEGWHNRLNSRVNARGPVPFYLLICALFSEATKIPLDLTMMSEGSLRRHQRRRYRHVEGQLFNIWDSYNEKQMSTSRLLKKISHLYGPPAQ